MNLSTSLGLKNPVLNFLNVLSSRVLLSYNPLSYKKKTGISHESQVINPKTVGIKVKTQYLRTKLVMNEKHAL